MDCPLPSFLFFSSFAMIQRRIQWLCYRFIWFQEGKQRDLFFPRAEGLTAPGESWYPHPVALFQRIVCTWWTRAKFKHTVPDSSSQQLHYPWCAQAPGEEPAKCCTFNFLNSPSPFSPSPMHPHVLPHFIVYIDTLLVLPPLPQK